jgi:ribosomal protection tetracycline resistance protein
MHSLNLGILAHVDAGKTTLTERLLYETGVLDAPGSVDAGTASTDSMELERRRGITIRTAVTSFPVGDLTVNLIDTPGHPDFIAEVQRALSVLDAAVLVVSAVEGVQPQTVVLWRALEAMRVPTLMFVNKLDRAGADPERVMADIRARLTSHAVSFVDGSSLEALADHDDGLLEAWLYGRPVAPDTIAAVVRREVARAAMVPVLVGSARTGSGVPPLVDAIATYLRPKTPQPREPSGVVFKVDRDQRGKVVFLRLRSGEIRVRERISLSGRRPERITSLRVSSPGEFRERQAAGAGQIAIVRGLETARVGDTFGPDGGTDAIRFPTPVLEAVVEPADPTRRGAMFAALTELAEQDPLISLHTAESTHEVSVRLYGEVQKEVIGALLADQYGIAISFADTSVVCIERVVGTGSAAEFIAGSNPYLATVGLRIQPEPAGAGVDFRLEVEAGSMPPAFFRATEEGVRDALRQGLCGWEVADCTVVMTHSGYWARQSHAHQKFDKAMSSVAADFRRLAPVVLMTALREAGTQVCEPINGFMVEIPTSCLDAVVSAVGRCGGVVLDAVQRATYCRLHGHLPARQVQRVVSRLPDLTGGAGAFTSELDHYRPVQGEPPERSRLGPDPLDRDEWYRAMPR